MTTQDMVVFLMRHKSEAFDKFREYKAEAEKKLGVHIKQLRSTEAVNTCSESSSLTWLKRG